MDFMDYVNQGIEFFKKDALESAKDRFKEAQKINPDNQDIQNLIMMTDEAIRLREAMSQEAANEARSWADVMGIKVEDVGKVIKEYTETLEHNQNDASVKSNLAFAHYIRGVTFTSKREYAQAIEDYSNAIKFEPDHLRALNKRGDAYLSSKNFDKAIEDFEELSKRKPDYDGVDNSLANAYRNRGIAHYEKKEYASAIPDFEDCLRYKPNDPTACEFLEMAKKG